MTGQWIVDEGESFEFCEDDSGISTPQDDSNHVLLSYNYNSFEFSLGDTLHDASRPVFQDLAQQGSWWASTAVSEYEGFSVSNSPEGKLVGSYPLSPNQTGDDRSVHRTSTRPRTLPILAPKPAPKLVFKSQGPAIPGLRPIAPKPQGPTSILKQAAPSPRISCAVGDDASLVTSERAFKRVCMERVVASNLQGASNFDRSILRGLSSINLTMGFNTSRPKSRLDTYITAVRQLIRSAPVQALRGSDLQRTISALGVLWTVREAWPAAEGYWNMTATFRGFLAAELWRNFPCERTYRQLPPAYRPTRAQLVTPHSPMIDWLPWPDVRDLAIKFQDQIDLDALFRAAIHNVVAHRKEAIANSPTSISGSQMSVADAHDDNTSFRVWDLICLEKSNGTDPLADPSLKKRAILRSPGVKAVLRAYDLEYDQFDTQKLDDRFFEIFPCLYCNSAASSWKVQSPDHVSLVDVGTPSALSEPALLRLKSRVTSLLDAKPCSPAG